MKANSSIPQTGKRLTKVPGIENSNTVEPSHDLILQTIIKVMREIGSELDLTVLLSKILEQAESLLNADRGGGIYLRDAAENRLCLVYGSGINQGREGITIQKGEGVAGHVYQTSQPLIIDDYTHWQGHATILVSDHPSAVMGVPMFLKGEVTGVMTIIANSQIRKFTDEDVKTAEMFAAQAAIAIRNAQLYELAQQEIADRKHAENTLRESQSTIDAIINSTSDLIWSVDSKTFGLITFNQSLHDYFFQKRGIHVEFGMQPVDLFPTDEYIQMWHQFYQRALAEGPYTTEYSIYMGTNILLLSFNLFKRDGEVFGVTVFGKDITERKQAEEKLKTSEAQLKDAQQIAHLGSWYWDVKTNTTTWSDELYRIIGWDSALPPPKRAELAKIYTPESLVLRNSAVAQAVETGKPYDLELEIVRHDDGVHRQVHARGATVLNSNGTIIALQGTLQDITEQKMADIALRSSEENYRSMAENSASAIAIIDRNGRILYANRTGTHIWNDPRIVGKTVFDIYPAKYVKRYEAVIKQVIDAQITIQDEVESPINGQLMWFRISMSPLKNPDGSVNTLLLNAWDMTERKQAEQDLQASEEKYRLIVETAREGIVAFDTSWHITFANELGAEILGYNRDEMLGKSIDDFVFDADLATHHESNTRREQGIPGLGERIYRRKDGSPIWLRISITPMMKEGRFAGSFVMMTDISTRKQAEETLRISEQTAHRMADSLRMVNEIGTKITSGLDLERLLQALYEECQRIGDTDQFYVSLYDDVTEMLSFPVNYENGQRSPIASRRNRVVFGFTEYILEHRKTLHIPDTLDLPPQGALNRKSDELTRSYIGVPLMIKDRVIGVLSMQSHAPNAYTPEQIHTLELLATQAAIAIHNSQLYEQAQQEIAERKQAEHKLRTSEAQLKDAQRIAHVGSWYWNVNTDTTIWSDELYQIIGWDPALPPPKRADLPKIYTPESLVLQQNALARVLETGEPYDLELEIVKPDGIHRQVRVRGAPVRDNNGTVIAIQDTLEDITERKKAEEQLRNSEERFRLMAENIEEGFWITDPVNDKEVYLSHAVANILGRSIDELMQTPKAYLESILPEDRPQVLENIEKQRQGEPTNMEYRIQLPDGAVRWIWDRAFPIFKEDGTTYVVTGLITDITERKLAEGAILLSEARYHSLVETQADVIARSDLQGNLSFVNDSFCQVFGVSRGQALNMDFRKTVFPEDLPIITEAIQAIHQPPYRKYVEIRNIAADGIRWFGWDNSTVLDDNRNIIEFQGVGRDITKRKQAEKDLHRQLTELETLYENGLVINQLLSQKEIAQRTIELLKQKMDWHHIVIRLFNPKSEKLELLAFTGYGNNSERHAEGIENHLNSIISRLEDGLTGWSIKNSETLNLSNLNADPRYKELIPGMQSGLYVPMLANQQRVGVISIESENPNAFSDSDERLATTLANQAAVALENARLFQIAEAELVERKRVETLLEEERNQLAHRVEERTSDLSRSNADLARALRVKDEFLASMSHELRTPLTGILGLSEAMQLKTYGELSEKQRQTLKNIEESGHHLLDLINDILDLSKIEAGMLKLHFEPCSLADICQASLQLTKGMAQHKKQQVHYSFPDEPVMVLADVRHLKQILVNLLSNAVKFSPQEGELGLDVQINKAEQNIKLTVWDKGIGIKPENMHKLFKPFTQIDSSLAREYSGSGLGLSLVHRLAELHNGGIEVESTFGEGSRFTVTLPWSPLAEIPLHPLQRRLIGERPATGAPPKDFVPPFILIADDNEGLLEMFADYLESQNYHTIKTRSGAELLERSIEIHPAVILVDIQMPGMDGLETIRRLRSHKDPIVAAAPVVAITALAMRGDRENCLKAGANEYLSKPVRLADLVTVIQKLIEKK